MYVRQVLNNAHSNIPALELTVSRAEIELGECERMIEMRKDADRRHRHWRDLTAEVKRDLNEAEMNLAGQVRDGTIGLCLFPPARAHSGIKCSINHVAISMFRYATNLNRRQRPVCVCVNKLSACIPASANTPEITLTSCRTCVRVSSP